ncbi:hypothetical protein BEWA_005450 [Theileria equi strain WA]|uniref:Uncharacterized protein n=1 Tax=Theileria equi strain WA TaxID=1537102 RepID=L0AZV1_THEEQ|nr:hypothetical protein BEWA_005450 [Theileria equi strain WA]AFZ81137.1 hypothetical protein BEWA_005450 [Theileria equi strain WA]|eukprot:XP_004830803.1 hypothetical protein BEWA_005450 [Theileria equi strain WA]
MLKYFVKPSSALVSQRIHLVPKMTPLSLIETIEDISSWKDKTSEPTVTLFTHCLSHALSLLPELRTLGVVRILFAYSKSGIHMDDFVPCIAKFLLHECKRGRIYESFYTSCTVNDLLLLYKGFETNHHYDSELHNKLVDCIIDQKMHMTTSDVCLFLKSHSNYIIAYEKESKAFEPLLYPEFAKELTLRLSQTYQECLPEELTHFLGWLVSMNKYYHIPSDLVDRLCIVFNAISTSTIRFNAEQLLSMVQSSCKLSNSLYEDEFKNFKTIITGLITAMLQEIERRNDVLNFTISLETLYLLNDINYYNFNTMQSIIYTVVNNPKLESHTDRVQNIIESCKDVMETKPMSVKSTYFDDSTLLLCDPEDRVKISEILTRLEKFKQKGGIILKDNTI